MAIDEDIYARIKSLVDEEHSLTGNSEAAARRRTLEDQLD